MGEIYDPIKELQQDINNMVLSITDQWQLKQIKRFITNIQKED